MSLVETNVFEPNQIFNTIKVGDYVIVQKQSFRKLVKIKQSGTITLGKDIIELNEVIGKYFNSTFRMIPKSIKKKIFILEEESNFIQSLQHNVNINKSGVDNRDIIDDGLSQKLSTDDILKLKDNMACSVDIVEKLVSNSKTFNEKTEYSQQKYLKKKETKYFEYIQIIKPSIRLIADILYRLDPGKIQGIRVDDLSQILTLSNVNSDSNVILYDSGTNGLLMAAITNLLGKNTTGVLIHMHPGNICQKEVFQALNFSAEQKERCINVCLYSVLRYYYQEFENMCSSDNTLPDSILEQNISSKFSSITQNKSEVVVVENEDKKITKKRKNTEDFNEPKKKKPCWQIDNERACKIIDKKVDALVIITKEYVTNIVHELLKFLKYGQPFVIYNILREPLQQLYFELKNKGNIIALKLSNNFVRNYQILENRSHPDVNMTFGGYILSGIIVDV